MARRQSVVSEGSDFEVDPSADSLRNFLDCTLHTRTRVCGMEVYIPTVPALKCSSVCKKFYQEGRHLSSFLLYFIRIKIITQSTELSWRVKQCVISCQMAWRATKQNHRPAKCNTSTRKWSKWPTESRNGISFGKCRIIK